MDEEALTYFANLGNESEDDSNMEDNDDYDEDEDEDDNDSNLENSTGFKPRKKSSFV